MDQASNKTINNAFFFIVGHTYAGNIYTWHVQ